MKNETLKNISDRRSVREYTDKKVSENLLKEIVNAGLCAPNAGGQCWHISVIENKDILDKLISLSKKNAGAPGIEFLKELGENKNFNPLYDAPVLIIVSAKEDSTSPETDSAAATENMLIAAKSLGIDSCWIFFILMAFFSQESEDLLKTLEIPNGYKPYQAAVFGYGDEKIITQKTLRKNTVSYIK